jgi:hypothetical protein
MSNHFTPPGRPVSVQILRHCADGSGKRPACRRPLHQGRTIGELRRLRLPLPPDRQNIFTHTPTRVRLHFVGRWAYSDEATHAPGVCSAEGKKSCGDARPTQSVRAPLRSASVPARLAEPFAPRKLAWFNIAHPPVTLLGHTVGGTGKLVCPCGLGGTGPSQTAPSNKFGGATRRECYPVVNQARKFGRTRRPDTGKLARIGSTVDLPGRQLVSIFPARRPDHSRIAPNRPDGFLRRKGKATHGLSCPKACPFPVIMEILRIYINIVPFCVGNVRVHPRPRLLYGQCEDRQVLHTETRGHREARHDVSVVKVPHGARHRTQIILPQGVI